MSATKEDWVRCPCCHCGNNLEYDANQLPETPNMHLTIDGLLSGRSSEILETECPNCRKLMWLYANEEGRLKAQEKFTAYLRTTLQECPVCQGRVAYSAPVCPHCGAGHHRNQTETLPVLDSKNTPEWRGFLQGVGSLIQGVFGLGFVLFLVAFGLFMFWFALRFLHDAWGH